MEKFSSTTRISEHVRTLRLVCLVFDGACIFALLVTLRSQLGVFKNTMAYDTKEPKRSEEPRYCGSSWRRVKRLRVRDDGIVRKEDHLVLSLRHR